MEKSSFEKSIENAKKEIEKGDFLGIEDLYEVHRKTIIKEAKQGDA